MLEKSLMRSCFVFLLFVSVGFLVVRCHSKEKPSEEPVIEKSPRHYVCPMFCDSLVSEQPGVCPVCGMDLEAQKDSLREKELENGKAGPQEISSLPTTSPQRKKVPLVVSAEGYLAYNPQSTAPIVSVYPGRIQKLYIKYNFQFVKKGQKLFDLSSSELLSAQQNLLLRTGNDTSSASLTLATKQKLLSLGMTNEQILHLVKTRKVDSLITFYAPFDGQVHEVFEGASLNSSKMAMTGNPNDPFPKFSIKEGMFVKQRQLVLEVSSRRNPWAILKVAPEYAPFIQVGQPVEIISESSKGMTYKQRVDFVESAYDPDSKFLNIRVIMRYADSPILGIGSFVKAKIETGRHPGMWIEKSSVLDIGNGKHIVFLKQGKEFQPKSIRVGMKTQQEVQVLKGLLDSDEIVSNAHFLMDSDSFVNPED